MFRSDCKVSTPDCILFDSLQTFVLYTGFSGVLFFLPMTVIAGWGVSEIATTVAFFPLTIFIGGMSTWSGKTAGRVGAGPIIATGAGIISIAFFLLGYLTPQQNYWGHVVPTMALMGLGMGFLVSPLSVAVMAAAPDAQSGAASGVNNAVARTAGLVAIAAMGAVAASSYGAAGGQL